MGFDKKYMWVLLLKNMALTTKDGNFRKEKQSWQKTEKIIAR